MSKYQGNLLAVRFAALEPEALPGDWDDVLSRAGVGDFPGPQQTRTTWLPRLQWRRVILAFALVVIGVVVTGSALATLGYQPLGGHRATVGHRHGSLDTSFGRGGKVKKPTDAVANALAIQQDGKLVAAGSDGGFVLVRYDASGSLDGSLGRGGKVRTPIDGGADARALAIQQDGKLVAAGGGNNSDGFVLVRYNPNGSLDRSFGRGGTVITPIGSNADARALAIQQDGKLVAAGHSTSGRGFKAGFALVRYNANGTLDRSFGRGGRVTTPTGVAYALAIQQDGKLVVAGRSGRRFTLARYHTSGTLDTSFGRGGKVTTPIGGGGGGAHALAIQQDGKLVVAGRSGRRFTLARYNANGTLDTSFGRGGTVRTFVVRGGGGASALAIQQDGKLVVAGGNNSFELARYHANGTLDGSFGRGGTVRTFVARGGYGASALAIQQDGKLVVAGGYDYGFTLGRYWP